MCILKYLDKKCLTPKICGIAMYYDTNNYKYCEDKSMLNEEAWEYCKDIEYGAEILEHVDSQYITHDVANAALRDNSCNLRYIPFDILTHDMMWYLIKERTRDLSFIIDIF